MGTNSNLFRFVSTQKAKFSNSSENNKGKTHENMINNNVTDFKDFEKTEIYQVNTSQRKGKHFTF